MNLTQRTAFSTVTILISLSMFALASSNASPAFTVESVQITVFRDGITHIEQQIAVDETYPEISLPLFSASVQNLLVLDTDDKSVDYEQNGSNLTVFTLGATKISLEYDTTALTNKDAEVWTLATDNPYNLTILLPKNSTVIYLSQMPTTISTDTNGLTLSIFPGQWEISYILPLVPTYDVDNSNGVSSFPLEYAFLAIGVSAAVVILVIVLTIRRRRPNVNKIVKANPQLMPEDKEVLDFIVEKGGKAFEAEIRLRFPDKPRTSLWRLIRRLERLEIVEVRKVGLENQVELKK